MIGIRKVVCRWHPWGGCLVRDRDVVEKAGFEIGDEGLEVAAGTARAVDDFDLPPSGITTPRLVAKDWTRSSSSAFCSALALRG